MDKTKNRDLNIQKFKKFLDKNNKIPDDFVEKYRHIYFN